MSTERTKAQTANDAKNRFILRFHDEGQRTQLKVRAALNHRTMNAEILFLIERGQAAVDGKQEAEKENAPSAGTGEALSAVKP